MPIEPLGAIIGSSPAITALRREVERLLARPGAGRRLPPLFVLGESGVGKGLLAQAIHRASARRAGPWVYVNCAAMPENLVEAELFGAERGAFTDARERRPGLFQAADRGVLFLDEVGTLPLAAQAKLLAAVEQRQVRRVGSNREEPVDVWIISATNDDLERAMKEKRFRPDLYHRLAAVPLRVPPLRERDADVIELAEHFLGAACAEWGRPAKRLTAAARAALSAYSWPGNVRELANVMERAALLAEATEVGPEVLGVPAAGPNGRDARQLDPARPEAEREAILAALEAARWSHSRAAARLGIPRSTLRYRIEKLGLRQGETAEAGAGGSTSDTTVRPPALQWERRQVTALQVALAPGHGADSRLPAALLGDLVAQLRDLGGHVDALHPGGFLALFGLGAAVDAPSGAMHAAWATRAAVERARRDVEVTCALDSLECLVGRGGPIVGIDPGDKQRLLAAVDALAGDAVSPGVLVGANAARLLDQPLEREPLGGPATVSECSAGTAAASLPASALSGPLARLRLVTLGGPLRRSQGDDHAPR